MNKYNFDLLEACGVIILGGEINLDKQSQGGFPYLLVQDPKHFVFDHNAANDEK